MLIPTIDAVSRKMFRAGGEPALLHGFNPNPGQPGNAKRIVAHGTDIDDGIIGIDRQVHGWRKCPVHPFFQGFRGSGRAQAPGQIGRVGRSHRKTPGEIRAVRQMGTGAMFEVSRNKQWNAASFLQPFHGQPFAKDIRQRDLFENRLPIGLGIPSIFRANKTTESFVYAQTGECPVDPLLLMQMSKEEFPVLRSRKVFYVLHIRQERMIVEGSVEIIGEDMIAVSTLHHVRVSQILRGSEIREGHWPACL